MYTSEFLHQDISNIETNYLFTYILIDIYYTYTYVYESVCIYFPLEQTISVNSFKCLNLLP